MVRGARPFMEGRMLAQLRRYPCVRKPLSFKPGFPALARRLKGSVVAEVFRIAKRIVVRLQKNDSNDHFLVIEPRMTGLLLVDDPPSREHLRFEFVFESESKGAPQPNVSFWDRRGLGTVTLYSQREFDAFLTSGKLGPDALVISPDDLHKRLQRTARPIKVALLDQKLVAGIGNLYASEILHLCRIHPETEANRVPLRLIKPLVRSIREVLETAIRYEGSTLSDGTYRNVLNQDGGYQNEHRVYQKGGEFCARCRRTRIERIVQAQRSTFFCSQCQKMF
ncbi:Formamidopyrimidine-DNA glycosylase [Polystyrenella longa]|uniref:Formamidopyrimidine-DNA glycosylase n=2 Tax=Polystyrenella longa TaxID=2528007 RepID=A0A518CQG2_9PLAN|nr:Formamidopyrimidine-DNA glycosylase [Polystyrenella longa]